MSLCSGRKKLGPVWVNQLDMVEDESYIWPGGAHTDFDYGENMAVLYTWIERGSLNLFRPFQLGSEPLIWNFSTRHKRTQKWRYQKRLQLENTNQIHEK